MIKEMMYIFLYLPFSKKKVIDNITFRFRDQVIVRLQLENYIKNNLGIKNYEINFTEKGAIPLFYPWVKRKYIINIGSAGGMTRLSTGYTFLNIQEHSKYLRKNLEKIKL